MNFICVMYYNAKQALIRRFLYAAVPLYPTLLCFAKLFCEKYSPAARICIIVYIYILGICAAEDMLTKTIPDYYNALLFITGIIFSYETEGFIYTSQRFLKIVILFAVLVVLFFVAKSGIGGGDIKMISASAAMIGIINAVSAFFTATVLAFPICIYILIKNRLHYISKASKTKQQLSLPFGPFLSFCIYLCLYNML